MRLNGTEIEIETRSLAISNICGISSLSSLGRRFSLTSPALKAGTRRNRNIIAAIVVSVRIVFQNDRIHSSHFFFLPCSVIYVFFDEPKLSPKQTTTAECTLGKTIVLIHVFECPVFVTRRLNGGAPRNTPNTQAEWRPCSYIMEHSKRALKAVVAYNTYTFATSPLRSELSFYFPFPFTASSPAKSWFIFRVPGFVVVQSSLIPNIDRRPSGSYHDYAI